MVNYVNRYFTSNEQGLITNTIYPFLGVLGNLCCANKGKYGEYLVKIKAISIVLGCIEEYSNCGYYNCNPVFERSLWVLSNLACDSPSNSLYLAKTSTMSKIFTIAKRPGLHPNISFEIVNYFCGSLHAEEPAISIEYYHKGIVEICCGLLDSNKLSLVDVSSECLKTLISLGFMFMVEGVHEKNFFLDKFVMLGGLELVSNVILKMKASNENETYQVLLKLEKWCKTYLTINDESKDKQMN